MSLPLRITFDQDFGSQAVEIHVEAGHIRCEVFVPDATRPVPLEPDDRPLMLDPWDGDSLCPMCGAPSPPCSPGCPACCTCSMMDPDDLELDHEGPYFWNRGGDADDGAPTASSSYFFHVPPRCDYGHGWGARTASEPS